MLEHHGVSEANWRDATERTPHFCISETPRVRRPRGRRARRRPRRRALERPVALERRARAGLRLHRPRRHAARLLALHGRGRRGRRRARRRRRLPLAARLPGHEPRPADSLPGELRGRPQSSLRLIVRERERGGEDRVAHRVEADLAAHSDAEAPRLKNLPFSSTGTFLRRAILRTVPPLSQVPRQRKRIPSRVCDVVRITRRWSWDVWPPNGPWWLSWTAPAGVAVSAAAVSVRNARAFRIASARTRVGASRIGRLRSAGQPGRESTCRPAPLIPS